MKYLTTLLVGLVLSLGVAFSSNAVEIDYSSVELFSGECTVIEKSSRIFSAFTREREVSGPCDSITDVL